MDVNFFLNKYGPEIALIENDIETKEGLKSAVLISLFTNRTDEIDTSGFFTYFGNALEEDQIILGSRLWLLKREKITTELLIQAKDYCEESLEWLLDAGVANSVNAIVEKSGSNDITIKIEIEKPSLKRVNFQFDKIWQAEINGTN